MVYIIKYIQVNKKRGSKYMERKQAKDLLDFIYDSPTAFHAVETVKKILDENVIEEQKERLDYYSYDHVSDMFKMYLSDFIKKGV